VAPSARSTPPASERTRRLRLPAWVTVAALAIVALTVVAAVVGPRVPAPHQACPAIGYSSVLTVTLEGATSEVAVLQVRDGDQWQPPYPPDAAVPAIPTTHDGDTWTFQVFSATSSIQLRVLDGDGDVLEQTEVDVGWVRVDGTAECGGPMEAQADWTI